LSGYAYAWEFFVPEEHRREFEHHYADGGPWTQLFRRAPGYVGTLLLADRGVPGRYVTVDRWIDESAYKAFRLTFDDAYRALDAQCEGYTRREVALGTFDEVVAINP
jgi:heme-degrading monooxygenase HmoA